MAGAMTRVNGMGLGIAAPRRAARSAGGFRLAAAEDMPAAARAGASAEVASLLALQEQSAPNPAVVEERAARRARQTLEELRGLQLDMLRGGVADPARLESLARLAEDAPHVGDPTLAEALAEIALRARVELARRRKVLASVS